MSEMKKYKSSLVVWNTGKDPIIETFHADTEEEIGKMQEQWMNDNNYTKANMHLYEQVDGEWVSIQQCEYMQMPKLPDFVFTMCSPHEDRQTLKMMSGTVLQTATGRILRVQPKEKGPNEGILNACLTIGDDNHSTEYTVAVLKLSAWDEEMLNDEEMDELKQQLKEDLFDPFGLWFVKAVEYSRKNRM